MSDCTHQVFPKRFTAEPFDSLCPRPTGRYIRTWTTTETIVGKMVDGEFQADTSISRRTSPEVCKTVPEIEDETDKLRFRGSCTLVCQYCDQEWSAWVLEDDDTILSLFNDSRSVPLADLHFNLYNLRQLGDTNRLWKEFYGRGGIRWGGRHR